MRTTGNPQSMFFYCTNSIRLHFYIAYGRIGQHTYSSIFTFCNDAESVRETVFNDKVIHLNSRYTAFVKTNLYGSTPAPFVIKAAAVFNFAVLNNCCAAKVIVDVFAAVFGWKSRAQQNGRAGRNVNKGTISDLVAFASVD